MQPTIASYFQKSNSANNANKEASTSSKTNKKRKAYVISSDEDEEKSVSTTNAPGTPLSKKSRTNKKTKTPESKSSTSSTNGVSKKPQLGKLKAKEATASSSDKELKPVDPMVLFGGETKRVQSKKPEKPKDTSLLVFEDDDIEQSMMEVDETILEENTSPKAKVRNSPNKSKVKKSPDDKPMDKEITNGNSKYKSFNQDLETSVLSDEERHERKRAAAILYQKYKNRSSVLNHGCKEIPTGKPNCLAGLSFLVTGILESLERDEAGELIKQYGGKVMSTVGKRLNYLIVGEESGPKKVAQAEEYGVKIISEDDFLDLIRKSMEEKTENNKTENGLKKSPKEERKTKFSPKKVKSEKSDNKPSQTKKMSPPKRNISKEKSEDSSPDGKRVKIENDKNTEKTVENGIKIKEEKLENVPEKAVKSIDSSQSKKVSDEIVAWVDKYKPTSVKEIVGQQGAASNVVKLRNWLSNWYSNHDGKKKIAKPNPWAKNDDGSYYKAALLSGPPGIGKTTTATLVSKELGFDIVEMNASDTRSKRLLQDEVSSLLSNKSLFGYFNGAKGGQAVSKKHVLLMDEVDGMAGNEDRGGIQELIGLIKNSSVPIICMCNDRNHQKMRSLVNYCYDLRFNRPQLKQIKSCIMSICSKERVKLDPQKIEEIIAATNNDIRQSINHVSLLSAGKKLDLSNTENSNNTVQTQTATKDLKIGPWEVVRKVFSAEENQNMSLNDKYDLFFHDYSLGPLFIQQNYLIVNPAGPRSEVMDKVARTADALSLGDLVEKKIRSQSAWSMLPTQATFSSVLPGEYMKGYFTGQVNFPLWLGKNSRTTKRSRLAQELYDHTRVCTSGSRSSMHLDYAKFLLDKIVQPLQSKGVHGVEESLQTIKDYHLLREDIESLIELTAIPGKKNPMDSIDGKVKAALTRAYNKEVLAYTYSAQAGVKKKRAEADDEMMLESQEASEGTDGLVATSNSTDSGNESDDNLENDGLIKMKKKAAPSATATTSKTAKKNTGAKRTTKSKK